MTRGARLKKLGRADIYPVICSWLCAGKDPLHILEKALAGGARMVQLREKDMPDGEFYELARGFRKLTKDAGALLVVNDRPDIALASGADGVHLGQDDMPAGTVRALAPDLIIGVSTHSLEEALQAKENGADYVNVGPIFETGTKEGLHRFLGPDAVTAIGKKAGLPFSVMGGIKLSNVDQVVSRGAGIVAAVTAITQADDVEGTVRAFRELIIQEGRQAGVT